MKTDSKIPYPSYREAVKVWVKVALYSFGGPAGQIAVMHKFLVEEKKWISENRFLHALNYCMLLPGPEAQQLATYIGWLLHKRKGGIVAGALFVLPGFLAILVLSIFYALWKDLTWVEGIFYGIKPAVLAIVVGAVLKIGKRALKNEVMITLSVLAFIAIFFFKIPFPYIIIGAGIIGFLGGKLWADKFYVIKGHQTNSQVQEDVIGVEAQTIKPSGVKTIKTALFWLLLWVVPVAVIGILLGKDNVFTQESLFFSKSAIVTFGGAYAVLAYISQKAVETYAWLLPGEMLDGLGMAETTPGPLIQVVQFVGFMGAYRNPGALDPVMAGVLASILVTWVTFIPCFLFIFVGAPYIEYLRNNKSLSTALSGITAAVVGVILNLGIWFTLHTLFGTIEERQSYGVHFMIPDWNTLDIGSLIITLIALFAYFRLKLNMLKTIGICVVLGLFIKIVIH
ncbi:chromate efflux transporter [Mariniflexile soesokkakense]|uniref:Chromate efflux transporter n=1 Tax=Mariniflexile soesokkakense TaxID=1343160 RepID=A0ABV0ADP6_9FLAO